MVTISTLFHRVDGFDGKNITDHSGELPDQNIETQFLSRLLEPLLFDPGDELVQRVLRNV
jgi:hypothetical protein